MAGLKEKMMDEVRNYVKHDCNDKGWPESNLTRPKQAGLRELKDKIEKKEIVVFKSDKSGKLTVDTPANYSEAISTHTVNDFGDCKLRASQNRKLYERSLQAAKQNLPSWI